MSIDVDPEWWKELFDEVYLTTDARSVCDDEVTRKEIDLIRELIPLSTDQEILDLCGGHGRHVVIPRSTFRAPSSRNVCIPPRRAARLIDWASALASTKSPTASSAAKSS